MPLQAADFESAAYAIPPLRAEARAPSVAVDVSCARWPTCCSLGFIAGFVRGGWSTGFLRRLVGSRLHRAVVRRRAPISASRSARSSAASSRRSRTAYADMVGYADRRSPCSSSALNVITDPILAAGAGQGRLARAGRDAGRPARRRSRRSSSISAAIVILDTYFGTAGALGKDPGLGFLKTVSQALDELDDRPVPDPHDRAVRAGRSGSAAAEGRQLARPDHDPGAGVPGLHLPFPDDRQGTVGHEARRLRRDRC